MINKLADKLETISVPCSIGVLALSTALILSVVFQGDTNITLTLIGALGGYIGGGRSATISRKETEKEGVKDDLAK